MPLPRSQSATPEAPDGSPLDIEDRCVPGAILGRYQIVRRVGRGGMATVFEARHVDLGKRVALKVLRPEYAAFAAVRRRFLREAKAAARIQHQHVTDVTDVCDDHGLVFLVMEFLEGEDLSRLIEREKRLTTAQTADLMVPVIAALATAHEAGVVHRDLKPSNIFLVRERYGAIVPKLLDFGISKIHDPSEEDGYEGPELTHTETVLGTPYYMAPELVKGAKNSSPLSDQYALGVVLYRCLSGRFPFRGATPFETMNAILGGDYKPLREHVPGLDAHLEGVIARAMSTEAPRRYPSLVAMGADLIRHASALVQAQWAQFFGTDAPMSGALHGSLIPSAHAPIPAGDLFSDAPAPGAHALEDPILDVDRSETTGVRRGELPERGLVSETVIVEDPPQDAPKAADTSENEAAAPVNREPETPPDPSLMFGTIFEMNVPPAPEAPAAATVAGEHLPFGDDDAEVEKTSVMPVPPEHVPTAEFTDTTEPERANVVVAPDLAEALTTRSPALAPPPPSHEDPLLGGATIPSLPSVIVERESRLKTVLGVVGLCLLGLGVGTFVYLRALKAPERTVVQGTTAPAPVAAPTPRATQPTQPTQLTPPPSRLVPPAPMPTTLAVPRATTQTAPVDAGRARPPAVARPPSGAQRPVAPPVKTVRPAVGGTQPQRPPTGPQIERTRTGGAILR